MRIDGPVLNAAAECEPILRALPQWFGIESALVQYVKDIQSLPTFIARDDNGCAIGFMSVRRHFEHAAELHVLGVLPQHHRGGVGRALLAATEPWLGAQGVRWLQVKTLSPSACCEHYEQTRRFYQTMGFAPLEEFPLLWGERNPCLQMVKVIGQNSPSAH